MTGKWWLREPFWLRDGRGVRYSELSNLSQWYPTRVLKYLAAKLCSTEGFNSAEVSSSGSVMRALGGNRAQIEALKKG